MASLAYTPLEEIEKIHAELLAGFNSGKTKSVAYRKYQLLQLAYLVQDNKKRFTGSSVGEVMDAYKNVETWAKPEKPPLNVNFMFMRPVTYKEPKGVVLIISPFNYPLWLCISPMAGAIAAGNAIAVKPSESCPAVASLLTELVPKYLDPSLVRVVNGAVPETTKLLDLPWGHRSARVGKIVAGAAAKTLTPVSLEVWKSPVFIDPSSDMRLAAKRILWGKFANGGQTCVAPDYVLVPKAAQDTFVDALKTAYAGFYPEGNQGITKIVNQQSFKRVNGLLQATKGTVVCGGETDESQKFIAPTIIKDVQVDDSLMSEEIFGPILPIVPVEDLDAAIAYVNAHDHPLALYVFSQDEAYKTKVFGNTQSGSAVANETILIPGITGLPFGGIGPSGCEFWSLQQYIEPTLTFLQPDITLARHVPPPIYLTVCQPSLLPPQHGFLMFTHLRATIDSPGWIDKLMGFRYPPYTPKSLAGLNARMSIKLPTRPTGPPGAPSANGAARKWFLLAFAMAVVGVLTKLKTRFAAVRA
ncbi:NAD-aldehyde dehydrogenase [Mycena vulgaris]|nr:NAD-aldehyde dehydrogenase [Mycena vulgaris]